MRTLYYIALLALPCQVLAETDRDTLALADQSYTDDLPIVLSATRLAQPLSEAPVAMTVIDRAMIEASGARNIPDLLRLVPGFQVGYFDGNSPVVAYHGHSNENNSRLQVLIDGRSVYDPALNSVPWSDLAISLEDIDRIEVIRGPNASTFGNNSFFAVISITTRHAVESQGHAVHFKAGAHATTDAAYTFGDQTGSLDYRMTVTTQNDNGTDLLRDETQAKSLNYRLDWQAGKNDRIMYQGGVKNISLGDHESIGGDKRIGHTIENSSAFQLIKWEYLPEADNSFSLQYYYNLHDGLEISQAISVNPQDLLPSLPYDEYVYTADMRIKTQRHDVEFNQFLKPGDDLRLVWGSSARLDIVDGTLDGSSLFLMPDTARLELYRGFAHGEWGFTDNWLFNAGYMVEYNDISGNNRSPRVALIHHINNQHTLRIGKSKATRTPTLFEEAGQLIYRNPLTVGGNPPPSSIPNEFILTTWLAQGGLDAERITSTEVGYIGEFLHNLLTLDITAFHDKTSSLMRESYNPAPLPLSNQVELNGIYPNTNGTVLYVENGLATTIRGIEIALDYKPTKNFRAYIFYSRLKIHEIDKIVDLNVHISAPEDSGGIMLSRHTDNNVDASLMLYRSEDFDWIDRNNDQSAEAYTKIDLRIAKNWQTLREKLTLALIGQNLLGTHYDYNKTTFYNSGAVNHPGSPQDRRIYLELGLKFN